MNFKKWSSLFLGILVFILLIYPMRIKKATLPESLQIQKSEQFFAGLKLRWNTTYNIHFFESSEINNTRPLMGPSQIPKLIFETYQIASFTSNKMYTQKECFYFESHSAAETSRIDERFYSLIKKTHETCPLVLPWSLIKSIPNELSTSAAFKGVEIYLSTDKGVRNGKNFFPPFHLVFRFKIPPASSTFTATSSQTIMIPLYNLKRGRVVLNRRGNIQLAPTVLEKFHSSETKRLIPGVLFLGLKVDNYPLFYGSPLDNLHGQMSAEYTNSNLIKCHEVNENCETVQEYSCDRCRYGWFETVGKGCPFGGTKYCGNNQCGGSKQPACPRGYFFNGSFGLDQCENGSYEGFCQNQQETFCDENRNLICP